MAKNYAKFVPPKYRTSRRKPWRAEVVIALCLVVTGALAFGGFLYVERTQGTVASSQRVSVFLTKVAALLHHRKSAAAPGKITDNKKLADASPVAEPVRFDFYNELPNMQMPVENLQPPVASAPPPPVPVATTTDTSAPSVVAPNDTATEEPPPPATEAPPPETAAATPTAPQPDKPASVTVEAAPAATSATPAVAATAVTASAAPAPVKHTVTKPAAAVFNSKEINDLLAAEQGVAHYVVQLGVFQTEVAANRLRSAVASVGFPVVVVKMKQDSHRVYSVQQGPYESAQLAKVTQQRLARRGIISIIQKA